MGILGRFKEIMSANANAILDTMEDPEKMIDQFLRNLQQDLKSIKSETATVMAEEKRSKRTLDEHKSEIEKLENYAMKALQNNNESDARKFLSERSVLEAELPNLQVGYESSVINATNMRKMHDKIVIDISELERKRSHLKAKFVTAKTQQRINETLYSSLSTDVNRSLSMFERYEEEANQALDKAAALSELNSGENRDIEDLKGKYDSTPSSSNIDDELEKLKLKMQQ